MCGWCLAYFTGVVLNAVGESATPDSKENKQADAGSRYFPKAFSVRRVVMYFFYLQSMKVYLHNCPTGMFSRTFYAQYSVTKNLHISPRFSPTIVYQDANSVLLLAHFCTAVFDY